MAHTACKERECQEGGICGRTGTHRDIVEGPASARAWLTNHTHESRGNARVWEQDPTPAPRPAHQEQTRLLLGFL